MPPPSAGFGPAAGKGNASRPGPYEQAAPELNDKGLPKRPGKEACLLYLNTGMCANGLSCIFHHPDNVTPPPPGQGILPQIQQLAAMLPGVGKPAEGAGKPDLADEAKGGDAGRPGLKDVAGGNKEVVKEEASEKRPSLEPRGEAIVAPVTYNEDGLPIRQGAQKCGSYLRGECRYGPGCRFDHPPGLQGLMAGGQGMGLCPLTVGGPCTTEGGLARRPGKEQCPFLTRTGSCPFGPQCRFDHAPGASVEAPPQWPQHASASAPKQKDRGLGGVKSRRPVATIRGRP